MHTRFFPTEKAVLIDDPLKTESAVTPDTSEMAETLKFCVDDPIYARHRHVFLREKFETTGFGPDPLVSQVMAQCLDPFIKQMGGKVVYATDYSRDGSAEISPTFYVVKVHDGDLRFLMDGWQYIQLPCERVAIRQFQTDMGEGEIRRGIKISMKGDAAAFHRRWEDFTKQNHYIRGRAAFPDGELIKHTRRYNWNDLIVPPSVRQSLRTHIETFFESAARLRAAGVKGRRGLILSGPPGTGKTLLGKVLADTLGVSFLWVLPRHLRKQKGVAEILEAARFLSPCVVFLEDLDLIGEDRNESKSSLLGELMNQLDGVSDNDGIITIASTNRLDLIEKALRNRPGRFDRVLEIGPPNEQCRRLLLQRLVSKATISEADLATLIRKTDGYSGAHLEEAINTIHLIAAERKIESDPLRIDANLIAAALGDLSIETKRIIGFGND